MAKRTIKNIFSGLKTAVTNIIKPPQSTGGITKLPAPEPTINVWTKDYVGGGAETTKTETTGGVTTTTVETDRTSGGGYITPTTTTTVTSPSREVISQQTTVAQPSYYDVKTVADLKTQSQKQQKYYQDIVNRGGNIEQANKDLNKVISEYQRSYYEQQGYNVIRNKATGDLTLSREVPQPKPIQEPIKQNIFQKINTFVQKGEREGYRDEEGNVIVKEKVNATKPLSLSLGTALGNTKWWKEKVVPYLKAKHPEMEQGLFTTGALSVGGKTVTIDLKKTYQGLNSFNKWIGFSPLMATGTLQQSEAAMQEGGYEEVTINGVKYRKNLLTGKLSRQVQVYDIISPNANKPYKAIFGGKEYLVTPEGRIIPIKPTTIKPVIYDIIKPTTSSGFVPTGTPSMVGGTGLKVLPQPSGVFDLTIELNRLPSNIKYAGAIGGLTSWLSPQQTSIGRTKQLSVTVPSSMLGLTPLVTSKYKSSIGQVQPQLSLQTTSQISKQILEQPQVSKQISISTSVLRTNQVTSQLNLNKLKTQQINIPKFKLDIIKLPIIKTKGKQVVDYFKTSSSSKNIFESFLKRRGKDISLGKFGDIGSAKTKFLKEIKSTLGASGFITKNKEVVPLKELNLGYEFKPSKKQPLFRAVQKRGFRLSSRGEVAEILSSKKVKGRKVKWL